MKKTILSLAILIGWLFVAQSSVAQFQMSGIELLGRLTPNQMGGGGMNDIWGWTDSQTGDEYALVGKTNGTAFVRITDGANPQYLGSLPTHSGTSTWRDIKVYNDHAYVVSEAGLHGMQIFDLTQLRGVNSPQGWSNTAHYSGGGLRTAHNIAINEDSGFAYIVGGNGQAAGGGLFMLDLANPTSPQLVGEYSGDGYTHDAQVVNYIGPDSDYTGREIAFASNEDTLTIVDVTNHGNNPPLISRNGYPNSGYTHQGWLSEDHRYFFLNDEFDEFNFGGAPRTHIFDVSDLDNVQYEGFSLGTVTAVDHNLYVKGDKIYQSNYTSGLRVLEITDPENAVLTEVAWIDTNPQNSGLGFDGSWSNYPFFDSGKIIVNDDNGLFIVRLETSGPDFNGDSALNCDDVNILTAAIAGSSTDSQFDLTGDGDVDAEDLSEWLTQAGAENLPGGDSYLAADANLDGVVDGVDFTIWNDNKFSNNDAFCSGDFNADGVVDGIDFTIWNDNKFQSADAVSSNHGMQTVPEPATYLAFVAMLLTCGWIRRCGYLVI